MIMPNIKYLVKRALKMDYKTMLNKINSIHKKTGKSLLNMELVMPIMIYLKCII